ncbi:uncharacterized protein LOC131644990 isoform X2 [Vicia villosa]|uniref:uncharacterized protein LOC131644990 isoform X2 n=1 Tax=Vicia villosa TaxID=3911 RepID=UPI00273C1F02|nr:uncharacterized protein LOC131644990 isoform X2 [Vicia villosa]
MALSQFRCSLKFGNPFPMATLSSFTIFSKTLTPPNPKTSSLNFNNLSIRTKIRTRNPIQIRAAAKEDFSSNKSGSDEQKETIMLPGCDYNHWHLPSNSCYCLGKDNENGGKIVYNWREQTSTPECLSTQLRTCLIKQFTYTECGLQFAEYILRNSKVLDTMSIKSASFINENVKHQMLMILASEEFKGVRITKEEYLKSKEKVKEKPKVSV